MTHWINANSEPGANVRSNSSTYAATVRKLSTSGALVEQIGSRAETDGVWTQYAFSDGVRGWVRGDVHKACEISSPVQLDVPYKSQNDAQADDHANDCGPASLAMMMAYGDVDKTVDEVSAKAGLVGSAFSHFNDLIRAADGYGFDAEHRRPMLLSDVLQSLQKGYPVLSLVNYDVLKPGKKYGHFIVVVGCIPQPMSKRLDMVIHDPNDRALAVYPASQLADALAYRGSSDNYPFQSLIFTNWSEFNIPKEPTDPHEDDAKERAIQILLDAMQQNQAAMKQAIEVLGG